MKTENTPQIYVGTYKKYNEGSLFGEWMDLTEFSDKDDFIAACLKLHKDEEDPELMFQDYENIPEQFIGESFIAEEFWEYMEAMENFDEDNKEALDIFIKNGGRDIKDMAQVIEDFEEAYCGHFRNGLEDYAYELVEEGLFGEIPESIQNYIDYAAIARDLQYGGDNWEHEGHVFRNI